MKKALYVVLFFTAIVSCKKKEKVLYTIDPHADPASPVVPGAYYKSLDEIYKSFIPPSKTLTFDAASGSTFYGNSGTQYSFPAGAFETEMGMPVSGNVQVEVTEYMTKSDMLFSGVFPSNSGDPLVSGGEVNIEATQNNQSLVLKKGKLVTISLPQGGKDPSGMQVYIGSNQDSSGLTKVNWSGIQKDSIKGTGAYYGPGYSWYDTVKIFSDCIRWINCDRILKPSNRININFEIKGITFDSKSTYKMYALFDKQNSVMQIYNNTSYTTISNTFKSAAWDIPTHFIVTAVVNGDFYMGILAVTPSNGGNYTIQVNKTTPTDFKNLIKTL
jgi:hypothetical protein